MVSLDRIVLPEGECLEIPISKFFEKQKRTTKTTTKQNLCNSLLTDYPDLEEHCKGNLTTYLNNGNLIGLHYSDSERIIIWPKDF